MRGVLLCGGEGTRLRPLTEVVNKHLVRVNCLPMAEYPLRQMISAGITEIMIVSGGENFAAVVKYFGSGRKWNVSIVHAIQDEPGGIAQAIGLAEHFVGSEKFLVILGDNIFNMPLNYYVKMFGLSNFPQSCMFFAIQSETPERFGVLKYNEKAIPVDVIEKSDEPPSKMILTGIYMYKPSVFNIIKTLEPSERGELEVTDINRHYVRNQDARIVDMENWSWSDCGTMETLIATERLIQNDQSFSTLRS